MADRSHRFTRFCFLAIFSFIFWSVRESQSVVLPPQKQTLVEEIFNGTAEGNFMSLHESRLDAEVVLVSGEIGHLKFGDGAHLLKFEMKNMGSQVWEKTGSSSVHLGTYCCIKENNNISPSRISPLETLIRPGEVATFIVPLQFKSQDHCNRGSAIVSFRLLIDNGVWFGSQSKTMVIQCVDPKKSNGNKELTAIKSLNGTFDKIMVQREHRNIEDKKQRDFKELIDARALKSRVNQQFRILVIVPCHRQELTVNDSIISVLNQTYTEWTLTIVDDGTPGKYCARNSSSFLTERNIEKSKAQVIWQENSGLAATRNNGLQAIIKNIPKSQLDTSYFLCFLDADDKINPDYFMNARKAWEEHPDADLIYANQILINSVTRSTYTWDIPSFRYTSAMKSGPFPVMTLIKLNAFRRIGPYVRSMIAGNEDYSFWLSCLENGVKAVKLQGVGSEYLLKPVSMMRSDSYRKLAKPTVILAHPGLYNMWEIYDALKSVFCNIEEHHAIQLIKLFDRNPDDCESIAWAYLFYLRRRDDFQNKINVVGQKLTTCLVKKSSKKEKRHVIPMFISSLRYIITDTVKCSKSESDGDIVRLFSYFNAGFDEFKRIRCESMLGSYITERKSSQTSLSDVNFVGLYHSSDLLGHELNEFSSKLSHAKSFKVIADGKNYSTLANNIKDIQIMKGEIHALYLSLGGKEIVFWKNFMSLYPDTAESINFFIVTYDKIGIDARGPQPASELMTLYFSDLGFTFMQAELGQRFLHDTDLTRYLSNYVPSTMIIQKPYHHALKSPSELSITQDLSSFPRIVHFVFGMSPQASDREFSMHHYLSIKSAHDVLRPTEIMVHCTHPPDGFWWEMSKEFVRLRLVRDVTEIFGNKVDHFAHKADIIRLEALLEFGGIYLDLDVWVYRSFDSFLNFRDRQDIIMAEEGANGAVGLCNAVIIAKKSSQFLRNWYDKYRDFNAKSWNYFSVLLPNQLANEFPSLIKILPHTAFFWPMWDDNGLSRLYLRQSCPWFQMGYVVHLWASKAASHLEELTSSSLHDLNTCLFQLARRIYYNKDSTYSNSTANIEMKDIVIGVLADSEELIETARRTWIAVALEMGIKCRIYISDVSLFTKLAAIDRFQGVVSSIKRFSTSSVKARNPHDWKPFVAFSSMYRSFPNALWYCKVDIDVLLLPDKFYSLLSVYNAHEKYLLGSIGGFHGKKKIGISSKYLRLKYAQGHTYALSQTTMKILSPHLETCNTDEWDEDKSMALCVRRFVGIQALPLPLSYYPPSLVNRIDRYTHAAFHHVKQSEMIEWTRLWYGRTSTALPALADGGYLIPDLDLQVRPKSYLGDPLDHKRHNFLSNRGAILSLWQENCFMSTTACGWLNITRTECLQIGCCFKDDFYPQCVATNGNFTSENLVRIQPNIVKQSNIVAQRICLPYGRDPMIIISSPNMVSQMAADGFDGPLAYLANIFASVIYVDKCTRDIFKCFNFFHMQLSSIDDYQVCSRLGFRLSVNCQATDILQSMCGQQTFKESIFELMKSTFWGFHGTSLEGLDDKVLLKDDWIFEADLMMENFKCKKRLAYLGEAELIICSLDTVDGQYEFDIPDDLMYQDDLPEATTLRTQ